MRLKSWRVLAYFSVGMLGLWALVMSWFLVVMNADLYGRLTETKDLGQLTIQRQPAGIPTVRLVIHRILADENAVEASVVFDADSRVLGDSYWHDVKGLTAGIEDASNFQSVYFRSPINVVFEPMSRGDTGVALRSDRFQLSVVPSMAGFPFDDVRLFVLPYLRDSAGYTYPFKFEVQKALPGRLLTVSGDPLNSRIRLSRSPTEKALVILGGFVFLALSVSVVVLLFRSSTGFKGWEELLAFGGYLVSAAGFREMLGISRATGASAFEVGVFGIPLVAAASVVVLALVRHTRQTVRDPSEPSRL